MMLTMMSTSVLQTHHSSNHPGFALDEGLASPNDAFVRQWKELVYLPKLIKCVCRSCSTVNAYRGGSP
jgi:hypothetical protein